MNTNTATKVTHSLKCDGQPLAKGVRMERPWSCSCGAKFHGYDSTVRAEFKAHKAQG